jgi:hypothetical protein
MKAKGGEIDVISLNKISTKKEKILLNNLKDKT